MSSTCETSGACETEASECQSSESRCGCGSQRCGGDPIECATYLWTGSFFAAMKQAQVEVLKAKIQKAWGAKMDKAADAVLEAMGVQWQSMLAQGQAKADLKSRLHSLWTEGHK